MVQEASGKVAFEQQGEKSHSRQESLARQGRGGRKGPAGRGWCVGLARGGRPARAEELCSSTAQSLSYCCLRLTSFSRGPKSGFLSGGVALPG